MIAVAAALLLVAVDTPEVRPLRQLADGTAIAAVARLAVDEAHIAALLASLRRAHPALTTAPSDEAPIAIEASASSHGVWRDKVYAPANVLDRDFRTAWVEGKKDHGLGESLTLTSTVTGETSAQLRGLLILPGYTKNPGMWRRNGRPQRMAAEIGDLRFALAFDDARRPQIFLLPEPMPLSQTIALRLTLEQVYAGTHYRDTSIAEVRFLFW